MVLWLFMTFVILMPAYFFEPPKFQCLINGNYELKTESEVNYFYNILFIINYPIREDVKITVF